MRRTNSLVFVDTNIPIYAAGKPHSLKNPCGDALLFISRRPWDFFTDAEVFQELLHRYMALRLWTEGRDVFRDFSTLLAGRVEPVTLGDIERASGYVDSYPRASARDLVHFAVMLRVGSNRLVSADQDFDTLPNVIRLDPAEFSSWSKTL